MTAHVMLQGYALLPNYGGRLTASPCWKRPGGQTTPIESIGTIEGVSLVTGLPRQGVDLTGAMHGVQYVAEAYVSTRGG